MPADASAAPGTGTPKPEHHLCPLMLLSYSLPDLVALAEWSPRPSWYHLCLSQEFQFSVVFQIKAIGEATTTCSLSIKDSLEERFDFVPLVPLAPLLLALRSLRR